MIVKGSYGRTLYESARAVLRVFRKGKADVLRRKDYWLHLGFGNINTGVFFGLELSGCSETVWGEGLWQITLKIENKPVHLWDLFRECQRQQELGRRAVGVCTGRKCLA